ncbi:MAG: DUF4268 domain-containing protein [Firmicutes bacterium HGW-Firmicutes-10]|jgi:uncharacterized protein with ParB-like and HNH nuclease domain|nr:MAG: DUF4268 domain-containing protein [Firmicutes bacterium HGW-Firmicutes-10]
MSLVSLKSVFKDRLFKIPDYQRGYAWKVEQLTDFWEDLVNLNEGRSHYMGQLSLKKVSEADYNHDSWTSERWLINDQDYVPFYVVDGQQRLTTLVIFINEMIAIIRELKGKSTDSDEDIYVGSLNLKQIKETYIVKGFPPQFVINTYLFGYEVDNPSFKYLKHKIFGETNGGSIDETFYTLNLENARQFFKENLKDFYSKFGIEELATLFKRATQNLMFNLHEIEDDFDVFVAFETMNNRGKRLSKLELLKNRLIYLTTLYDDRSLSSDEKLKLRCEINDSWKEIYHQLGRNKTNPLHDDDFLYAHWIMYFQYTRKKSDDYIVFLLDEKFTPRNVFDRTEIKLKTIHEIQEVMENQDIEDNGNDEIEVPQIAYKLQPKEIQDYVNSLKTAAKHWYNTFNPLRNNDLTSDEQKWIDRLNRLGMVYFRPLIVSSFLRQNIDSEERTKLFQEIERFIFISFRLGRAYTSYGSSQFNIAARRLRLGEISTYVVIDEINKLLDDWLSPNKGLETAAFKTYLTRQFKQDKGYYGWNGLHYLLYEYEMMKVSKSGNQKLDWDLFVKGNGKDKVTLEHIYPREDSNDYWTKRFSNFDKSQKTFLSGSIGNLLPLSQSKNSSLQNDSFTDKKNPKNGKSGYSTGSHSEIEVSLNDEWGPKEIYKRGVDLLNFLKVRWRIIFKSEDEMRELLFLDFINEES